MYNTIQYLDSRQDTTNMGIVQLGVFNNKARVVPRIPFSRQLTILLNALTDSTAQNGRLLLQLKQLNFAEVTGSMSEKGYFYFRANLYADSNGAYQRIATIDTLTTVSGMDVTKMNLRQGNKLISGFIANHLVSRPADAVYYSRNDVINIDSIEKLRIKLYTTPSYTDGVYLTYRAFKDQTPDKPIMAELKNGNISSVKTTDESGRSTKVKSKNVYAVVYQGRPFVATEYGFYSLEKRNNDFFFIGQAKVTANTANVIAASAFFGVLGGLMASNAEATFEMQIDHVSGGFIHIREIRTAEPPNN